MGLYALTAALEEKLEHELQDLERKRKELERREHEVRQLQYRLKQKEVRVVNAPDLQACEG